MWILTQNEKRILSTEGMEEINVAKPADGKSDFAVMIRKRVDGKSFALGFYQKENRAIAIVKEIMDTQAYYIRGGGQSENIIIPPKAYKMPADETD